MGQSRRGACWLWQYAGDVKTEVGDPCSLAGRLEGTLEREHLLTIVREDMVLM